MLMLQESPLYAYFPARDLDRACRFYEEKLAFVPKSVNNGGVTYEFADGTAAFRTRPTTQAPQRRARRSGRSRTSTARSPS